MDSSQPIQESTATKLRSSGFAGKRWMAITLVILCVLVSWVGVIDVKTNEYVKDAIFQALGAYAGARTLNAGISVLQSGEMGGDFLIAEMSIRPFESLDPLNDMVEDYATVMKYAIGSLMIQKLLVNMLSTSIFKWLLTGAAFLLIADLLLFNGLYSSTLFKFFIFVALVRFLFVITIFIIAQVDNVFVNEKTVTELEKVNIAKEEVKQFERSTSGITTEEREKTVNQINVIKEHIAVLNTLIKQNEKIVGATGVLVMSTKALEDYENNLPIWVKYNPIPQNEKHRKLRQAVKDAEVVLKEQNEILKTYDDNLRKEKESLAILEKKLNGEEGLIESAKDMYNKAKALSFSRVEVAVSAAIQSMLELMAIFVFKTLLMPLAFLLLILRGFKMLWGIDTSNFLRGQKTKRIKA